MSYCPSWPIDLSCLPPGWDPNNLGDAQRAAIDVASQLLKAATGWRYGPCLVTVRPCSPDRSNPCTGPCGCHPVCRVMLPGPVTEIAGITVDGAELPAGAWRVDSYMWLVRQDGRCFPACQRLDLPAGEPGTWTVTYWRGYPVPAAGVRAVTALAARIYQDCTDSDGCWIDPRVTRLNRAGVTYELDQDSEQSSAWLSVPAVSSWVASVNPHRLAAPMVWWSPEMGIPHQTTSTSVPFTLTAAPQHVQVGETVTVTAHGAAGTVVVDWGDGVITQ